MKVEQFQMNRKCKECNKIYYSSKGNEYCRPCLREKGLLSDEQLRRILNQIKKNSCGDAHDYKTEIMMFSIKAKWDMLNEIDYYLIADLYLKIVCDEVRYSQNEPKNQIIYMLSDLRTMLMEFPKKSRRKKGQGKIIIETYSNGSIKRKFTSIKNAAIALDLGEYKVRSLCNKKKKFTKPFLYWEKDYKPN